MSLAVLHSHSSPLRMKRGEDLHSPGQPTFADTFSPRPFLSIAPSASSPPHHSLSPTGNASISSRTHEYRDKKDADAGLDDGYDSDATLDLDHAGLSPLAAAFLQGAPPLRRMSRSYERVVLSSLSQGRDIAYACACSRGVNGRPECARHIGKWTDEDEYVSDDSDIDYEVNTGAEVEGTYSFDSTSDHPALFDIRLENFSIKRDVIPAAPSSMSSSEPFDDIHDHDEFDAARKGRLHPDSRTGCAEASF